MLIPSEEIDLSPVYAAYPELTSIIVEGRHGGSSYSLSELEERDFIITNTGRYQSGDFVVQVEIPAEQEGNFDRVQFVF